MREHVGLTCNSTQLQEQKSSFKISRQPLDTRLCCPAPAVPAEASTSSCAAPQAGGGSGSVRSGTRTRPRGRDKTGPGHGRLTPAWHGTLSPPTRKRSTAAPLMPCRSHSPDRISLMEKPDLTATTQDVPSGRWTQQCLAALSLSSAEVLQASDCRVGDKCRCQDVRQYLQRKSQTAWSRT